MEDRKTNWINKGTSVRDTGFEVASMWCPGKKRKDGQDRAGSSEEELAEHAKEKLEE